MGVILRSPENALRSATARSTTVSQPVTDISPVASSLAALVAAHRATGKGERRWQENANCLGVDPDLFFPERGASTREAKAVCRGCEVRMDCLEYALAHGEKFGIWGGLSERERRRVRRQRALERRTALGA
jgi:WhiB family redox-sensing transcriptional regulator